MPRGPLFVTLDDQPHVLSDDERTACGIVVAQGNTWTTDQPADLCDECADKAGLEKPKAKSGRKA